MGNTISIKPLISFNKSLHLPSYQWDEIPVSTPEAAQWLWCQSNKSTVFSNALLKTRSHKWELGSLQGKIASQTPIHRSFLSEHTHIITSPSYRGSKTAPVNFIWCNDFSPRWKYKPYIYIYIHLIKNEIGLLPLRQFMSLIFDRKSWIVLSLLKMACQTKNKWKDKPVF